MDDLTSISIINDCLYTYSTVKVSLTRVSIIKSISIFAGTAVVFVFEVGVFVQGDGLYLVVGYCVFGLVHP